MTDEIPRNDPGDDPGDDPGNSPENSPGEDARIRALLAELGSGPDGESMPPEVAARLDDTLARLVAERTAPEESDEPSNVVPLRRRWGARITAAAAAVIVIGAGGVAATNLGVFGGAYDDSATSSSDAGGSSAKSEALAPSPSAPGTTSRDAAKQALALPRVRSTAFASDVTALVREEGTLSPAPLSGDLKSTEGRAGASEAPGGDTVYRAAQGCRGPAITDDAVPSPITYDGRVAVLVVHPERDGQQLVEAWNCQGTRTLDSATITP